MNDVVIRVENLGKLYRIGERVPYKTLRDALARPFRRALSPARSKQYSDNPEEGSQYIWALKGVSFKVRRGEVVGIIGRNGAGKTTLLKILSRITEPTEGWAEVKGRVGSLLDVGTGFHPELTGRENVFLNGAVLGMRKEEIERKFDEIVAFAELNKFIDTPIKYYSTGMYMRLAFSVAAHLEPEILLVDEVLAVGDLAFQKKCLGKMGDVARRGRTVLFVSHNMAAISRLCSRAILLDEGNIVADGMTEQVIDQYYTLLQLNARQSLSDRRDRQGTGEVLITEVRFYDEHKHPLEVLRSGQTCYISFHYKMIHPVSLSRVSFGMSVYNRGSHLFTLSSEMVGEEFRDLSKEGEVLCRIERLPLAPGVYSFNVICRVAGAVADWVLNAGEINVEEGDFFGTGRLPPRSHPGLLVPHKWFTTW